MKICFIGNNANGNPVSDGGRIKMRNIMSEYIKMGHEVTTVDLYKWQFRFASIILKIKKALRHKDVIIIMAGPRGSRMVLKLIQKSKKTLLSKVVFIPVGLGTIDLIAKKLKNNNLSNFINSIDYYGRSDKRIGKCLWRLSDYKMS